MSLRVKAVTAWVTGINTIQLTRGQFVDFKERLVRACDGNIRVFEPVTFEKLWLARENPPMIAANERATDRFPTDLDHVKSNIVQHSRTEWARRLYDEEPDLDVITWLDYGVLKQGAWRNNQVTEDHVREFMKRIADYHYGDIPFPGIEERKPVSVHGDNWRFVGSTHIWPTRWLHFIDRSYRAKCRQFIRAFGCVPLDLAIWPSVEADSGLPFRWYKAEYDASQFTNFPKE